MHTFLKDLYMSVETVWAKDNLMQARGKFVEHLSLA
jgi:hypothetical protein